MTTQPSSRRRLWYSLALVGVVAAAIWLPRAFALDRFTATDEVIWLWRSANFYYALGQRDFAASYVTNHPGVVTLWIEATAFLLDFPEYRGFGQGRLNKYAVFEDFSESKGVDPHEILVTSRELTVWLNTTLLVLSFLYARKLFGDLPSMLGFLMIAFDPFHNGITRMAHLDGPMGSFAFLSLLAFLNYVHNGKRTRDLFVSAGAGGLSILAKIPGFIIFPAFGLIAFWDYWKGSQTNSSGGGTRLNTCFSALIKPLVLWGAVALVTVFLLFPAMWVKPWGTLQRLVLSPARVADNLLGSESPGVNGQPDEQIEIPVRITDRPLDYVFRYPYRYVWRITPILLAGLSLALAAFLAKISLFANPTARNAVLGLLFFVLAYTIFMTIPPKSSEKYYLPVYTVLDLIAGIGWYAGVDWARRFVPSRLRNIFPLLILVGVILIQATLALRTFPYYVTYFNPLLGGNRRANETLTLGSGEGLDLAADYLNQKPDADQLKVMSWYGVGPFSYYFKGQVLPLYGSTGWDSDDIARLQQADYLVVYVNQWKRQLPGGLFPWLEGVNPEQRVWFDGIELARIYDVKSIPSEKFSAAP